MGAGSLILALLFLKESSSNGLRRESDSPGKSSPSSVGQVWLTILLNPTEEILGIIAAMWKSCGKPMKKVFRRPSEEFYDRFTVSFKELNPVQCAKF